jgi:outer membrane lipoprotein LolB
MRNLNLFFKGFFLTSLILLSGCAAMRPTLVTTTPLATWQQQQSQVERLRAWQLSGRMGVHLPNRNLLTSLVWSQQPQQYQITVYSPLNLGSVKIIGNDNRVTLWKTATESVSAASPEQLMQNELGWQLPISNLHYWVRGLPAPGSASQKQFDTAGHLIVLQQQGWTIHYRAFQTVQQIELPSRMELNNNVMRIRIVVQQWQLLG